MDSCWLGELKINRSLSTLVAVLLVSSALVVGSSSSAEEISKFRYGIDGNNQVFSTLEQAIAGGSFRLAVKEGQRAKISVELVDVFANASGTKSPIPLGASPFTADGLVKFKGKYPLYEPSEDFQFFDVSFRFRDDVVVDRPVLGGLSISLVPEDIPGGQTIVQSSIVATFAYLPTGMKMEEYAPGLKLAGPKIDRKEPDYFPMNLLPNFPFLQNHGDLILGYELTNTGEIFLETTTELNLEQVGVFGQQDEAIFIQSNRAFLLPAQVTSETIDITSGQVENKALGLGLYRFTLTSTGQLGSEIGTSAESEQLVLIFPWKQSLIALGLVAVFRRRIRRAFSWVLAYGKALKDFRYSKDPNPEFSSRPNPAPLPKLGVSANPSTTGANAAARPSSPTSTATPTASIPSATEAKPLYPFWYEPPKKGGDT